MSRSSDSEFSAYVAARSHALERHAFVLTGDRHRAEDLVQHALLRVYRRHCVAVRGRVSTGGYHHRAAAERNGR